MTQDRDNHALGRTEQIAFKLFEARLSPEEAGELDRLLTQVDGAAEVFARYADTHAMLEFAAGRIEMHQVESEESDQSVVDSGDSDQHVFDALMQVAREERRKSELKAFADLQLKANAQDTSVHRYAYPEPSTPKRVVVIPKWVVYAGGTLLAAMLVIALYPFYNQANTQSPQTTAQQNPTPPPVEPVYATLSKSYDAVWSDVSEQPQAGQPFSREPVELVSGFAELTFADGASVILRGPAKLRVASAYEFELDRGLLKATVPPGAEGFTVITPAGRVVDLGTEFGVDVQEDGQTKLDVMTGKIIAEMKHLELSQELIAGQGTILSETATAFDVTAALPESYPLNWGIISDQVIAKDAGLVLFAKPRSLQAGSYENSNRIIIFQEQGGLALPQDLPLSIIDTDKHERIPQVDLHKVAAGTRIDSYLLHFDAIGEPDVKVEATATFYFKKPIIGLIVSHEGIAASDAILNAPQVIYPSADTVNRGLEGREHQNVDRLLDMVQMSDDRKSITIRMGTTKLLDQARVILQADDDAISNP